MECKRYAMHKVTLTNHSREIKQACQDEIDDKLAAACTRLHEHSEWWDEECDDVEEHVVLKREC